MLGFIFTKESLVDKLLTEVFKDSYEAFPLDRLDRDFFELFFRAFFVHFINYLIFILIIS